MTTRKLIRLLAPATALLALVLALPATAAEVPMIVGEPVLDVAGGARAQAGTLAAAAKPAAGRLHQVQASLAPAVAASETSTDSYCGGDQGRAKSRK